MQYLVIFVPTAQAQHEAVADPAMVAMDRMEIVFTIGEQARTAPDGRPATPENLAAWTLEALRLTAHMDTAIYTVQHCARDTEHDDHTYTAKAAGYWCPGIVDAAAYRAQQST